MYGHQQNENHPTCHIHINNETITQVEKFKYLGSTITSDGGNDAEIKIRISMAKDAFQKMEKVIKNKNITIETRNRILQCYMYTLFPSLPMAASAGQYHHTWKESWRPQKCGFTEECYTYLGRTMSQMMRYWGEEEQRGNWWTESERGKWVSWDILSWESMDLRTSYIVTGKIEGERSRGRPRLNFMKSLSQLLKISKVEIIERTRNREEWITMTANVRIGYGT